MIASDQVIADQVSADQVLADQVLAEQSCRLPSRNDLQVHHLIQAIIQAVQIHNFADGKDDSRHKRFP